MIKTLDHILRKKRSFKDLFLIKLKKINPFSYFPQSDNQLQQKYQTKYPAPKPTKHCDLDSQQSYNMQIQKGSK